MTTKTNLNFNTKLPPMTRKQPEEPTLKDSVVDCTTETLKKVEKKKKKPKRCQLKGCKKKLSITSFDCRCEKRFCNFHKAAESHQCTFDYKSFHRKNLVGKGGLGGGEIDKVGDRV